MQGDEVEEAQTLKVRVASLEERHELSEAVFQEKPLLTAEVWTSEGPGPRIMRILAFHNHQIVEGEIVDE